MCPQLLSLHRDSARSTRRETQPSMQCSNVLYATDGAQDPVYNENWGILRMISWGERLC